MKQTYIHGFSSQEQNRLSRMQDILNRTQLGQIDLSGVRRVLDVGSGLGQLSRMIAEQLTSGSTVIGVERNEQQLSVARQFAAAAGEDKLVEFRAGDATSLPLANEEWGSFDLVHARFLLEHVADPLAVVKQMVAAARVGGRIILMDDDHDLLRIWPKCDALEWVWREYWGSYNDLGHDPLVGRKMPELLVNAGARVTNIASLFYGATRGQPLFDPVVDNLLGVISGASDSLAASGRVTVDQMNEAIQQAENWRLLSSATVWYSLPIVIGVREP